MSSDLPPPAGPPAPEESNPAIRARVPDHVADGCFSTGVIVMTGPTEYIVDFLQTIGRPHRIAARVVIPHPVMPQFIDALQKNLAIYRSRFGEPAAPAIQPPAANQRRPTPQEIYDDLKMPDETLSGTYANGVMIGHGATEFGLDFLTNFFPQSAVSARVFLAAGQVPRLLDSLKGAVRQSEQRRRAGPPTSAHDPSTEDPTGGNPTGAGPTGAGHLTHDPPPPDRPPRPPETSGDQDPNPPDNPNPPGNPNPPDDPSPPDDPNPPDDPDQADRRDRPNGPNGPADA